MRRSITLSGYGNFAGIIKNNIVVKNSKREVEDDLPLSQISNIVIQGSGTTISSDLLIACGRRNIPIIVLDFRNRPSLIVHKKLQFLQSLSFNKVSFHFTCRLIEKKIRRQQSVINYHSHSLRLAANTQNYLKIDLQPYLAELKALKNNYLDKAKINDVPRREKLFLIEARAGRIYWKAFAALLDQKLGFQKRIKRHPMDVVNQLLNYCYALLTGLIVQKALQLNFDLSLSLLHHRQGTAYPLIFDLIEPFRPLADHAVLVFLHRQRRAIQDRHDVLRRSALRRFRKAFFSITDRPQPWLKSKLNLEQVIAALLLRAPGDLKFTLPLTNN